MLARFETICRSDQLPPRERVIWTRLTLVGPLLVLAGLPSSDYKDIQSPVIPTQSKSTPANTTHRPNVGAMLGRRRRRRANIGPALGRCVVFARRTSSRNKLLSQHFHLLVFVTLFYRGQHNFNLTKMTLV